MHGPYMAPASRLRGQWGGIASTRSLHVAYLSSATHGRWSVTVGVCANAPSAEISYTANEQRELMDMRMRNGRGDGADEMD